MQGALEKAINHWNMVAPVIDIPKSPEDYQTLLKNLKDAMLLVENTHESPLNSLIKAIADAAHEYENQILVTQQASALQALRYLIKLHNIKQSDLREIGSQGVVSEILNGKRSLTLRHVKALSKKFNVSPSVFIDQ